MANSSESELRHTATQLLAGLLANPHIYPTISDEWSEGQQEHELVRLSIRMAKFLAEQAENETK